MEDPSGDCLAPAAAGRGGLGAALPLTGRRAGRRIVPTDWLSPLVTLGDGQAQATRLSRMLPIAMCSTRLRRLLGDALAWLP